MADKEAGNKSTLSTLTMYYNVYGVDKYGSTRHIGVIADDLEYAIERARIHTGYVTCSYELVYEYKDDDQS